MNGRILRIRLFKRQTDQEKKAFKLIFKIMLIFIVRSFYLENFTILFALMFFVLVFLFFQTKKIRDYNLQHSPDNKSRVAIIVLLIRIVDM